MITNPQSSLGLSQPDVTRTSRDAEPGACSGLTNASEGPLLPPKSGVALLVDAARFKSAISKLPISDYHEACRQLCGKLEQGEVVHDPGLISKAAARLESLSLEDTQHLVRRFFTTQRDNPILCPLPGYDGTITNDYSHGQDDYERLRIIARALLQTGMPPLLDLVGAAYGTYQNLLDPRRDLGLTILGLAGASAVAASTSTLSTWTAISIALGGAIALRYIANLPNAHNEACAGYVTESLDLFHAVANFNGNVPQLGASLNSHFANPDNAENYGKPWRASGFILARAARILAISPSVIDQEFRALSSIDEPSDTLMNAINSVLSEEKIPEVDRLLAPFMETTPDSPGGVKLMAFLDEMNYAYVSWGALEAQNIRHAFADAVVKFE